jgi:hypothetical protein
MTDPERRRLDELIGRVAAGEASEAERVELDMYLEDDPALQAEIDQRIREHDPDAHWLARAEADRRITRRDSSARVRAERTVGLGLVAGGFVLGPLLPVAAPAALLAGVGLLTWSFVRLRLEELRDDPYRKIDR